VTPVGPVFPVTLIHTAAPAVSSVSTQASSVSTRTHNDPTL
jgi:hypothetical protein